MKKPRIVLEEQQDGRIRLKVDNVHGAEHAVWLLATATQMIVTQDQLSNTPVPEEVKNDDTVQELPDTAESSEVE